MHSYNYFLDLINKSIQAQKFEKSPNILYKPIDYTLSLGGKRLRPVLTLMACELYKGDVMEAIDPAFGVEIFHNFTLVHDDIMDNAPIRRGKPSVFKKWDLNVAVLSGDTMFALAYKHISNVDKDILPEVLDIFTKTAIEVCEGQQYDMDFERSNETSIPDYLEMIRLKTAVLLGASLKLGAVIARAKPEEREKIYKCGENLGMAFQLKDDLLDTFADEKKFGKKIGGDIIANKKTFLYLKALEVADRETKQELLHVYNGANEPSQEKIRKVKNIFNKLNIEETTKEQIKQYSEKAINYLEEVDAENKRKENLRDIIYKLVERDY